MFRAKPAPERGTAEWQGQVDSIRYLLDLRMPADRNEEKNVLFVFRYSASYSDSAIEQAKREHYANRKVTP